MSEKTILVAEDDDILRNALQLALASEGYRVRTAADGKEALDAFAECHPDLVVLDVMMPRMSGYDVCAEIRRRGDATPIIFLTAKSSDEDMVLGLGLGADDFIAKPLKLNILLARIAVVFRWSARTSGSQTAPQEIFSIGAAKVYANRYTVSADGMESPLSIRELGLLKEFAAHPGEVLSRNDLIDEVWGMEYGGTNRTLDQHIVQIRRKLGSSGALVETIRGVGYRLKAKVERLKG